LVAEEDFGRDRDELTATTDTVGAPVDPEDVGRAEVFSFAPDEDGTGALDSLGGWYTCGGGGPTLSVSLETAMSSTGVIASTSLWSKIAFSFELGDMSPVGDIHHPLLPSSPPRLIFRPADNVDLALG
jgi:hypothetical protein